MITETEARQHIQERTRPLAATPRALEQALGWVLAEDVVSDIDSPPYDKALVDGYAVRSEDFTATDGSDVTLRVLEEVTAGCTPAHPLTQGSATRIMTGAPLPVGADAVVMVEQSETLTIDHAPHVRLSGDAKPEQHLMRQGTASTKGSVAVRAGALLRSIEIGVLAESGCTMPTVFGRPTAAIISTGDELIDPDQAPQPGQIRNSNGPMLAAQAREAGATPVSLGVARDDVDSLAKLIRQGLESDVVVLSGGVSAGVLDLAPPALKRCGVRQVFHKVLIKPGKPVWFGRAEAGALVFGLPGNPVGSLVCFERFVKPALQALAGRSDAFNDNSPRAVAAALTEPFFHRGPRPTYRPGRITVVGGSATVAPIPWQGSADIAALANSNCLIAFPAGDTQHPAGAHVTCHLLD